MSDKPRPAYVVVPRADLERFMEWLDRTRDERNFPAHLFGWCEEANRWLEDMAIATPLSPPSPLTVEAIARIVEPQGWRRFDTLNMKGEPSLGWIDCTMSLMKARAILALLDGYQT